MGEVGSFGFRVPGLVSGFEFRVPGLVSGFEFRVSSFRLASLSDKLLVTL